jgi:hypothetical protein
MNLAYCWVLPPGYLTALTIAQSTHRSLFRDPPPVVRSLPSGPARTTRPKRPYGGCRRLADEATTTGLGARSHLRNLWPDARGAATTVTVPPADPIIVLPRLQEQERRGEETLVTVTWGEVASRWLAAWRGVGLFPGSR